MIDKLNLAEILQRVKTFEDFEKLKSELEIWKTVANKIMLQHDLPSSTLQLCEEGTNIVFYCGENLIIKLFPPFHFDQFNSEQLVLKHLQGKLSVSTPELRYEGEILGWPYLVMTRLSGTLLETLWDKMAHSSKLVIIRELGQLIQQVHAIPTTGLGMNCRWNEFISQQIKQCETQHQNEQLAKVLLPKLSVYLEEVEKTLYTQNPVLLTGEYTPMNFLVKQEKDAWHISGLFDFGDAMLGLPQYDLLGPGAFLIQGNKELLKAFLLSYGYKPEELTKKLSHQLTALMLLHQYSNLDRQIRIEHWQDKVNSLEDLENLVWG